MSRKTRTQCSIVVTFSTMVEMQRQVYEIVKSVDPAAKVLTPSPQGGYGPGWMSRFLASGGGNYADIMAFHGYLVPGANTESVRWVDCKI